MLDEHLQKNNVKSSLFSQHSLEVNSIRQPEFSNPIKNKPFNKPFSDKTYAKASSKSMEQIKECTFNELQSEFSSESNAKSPCLKSNVATTEKILITNMNEPFDSGVFDNLSISSENIQQSINKEPIQLSENEQHSELPDKASNALADLNLHDTSFLPPLIDSITSHSSSHRTSCNVTPSLMELSSLVYVSPSYSVSRMILPRNLTVFPPSAIESLLTLIPTPQSIHRGHQQHRKPFPTSKIKYLHNMPASFQANRLYGMSAQQYGANKEYYVMVHIEAGATFSIRTGDQEQQIPGPATVRLVLNNGPPSPMPMQVPPGYLVQQIVDEDGVLIHIILSPMVPHPLQKSPTSGLTESGTSAPTHPPATGSTTAAASRPSALTQRIATTGGVNVIISPMTSPGLAVAGPTWPTHSQSPSPPPLLSPRLHNQSPTATYMEQQRKSEQDKKIRSNKVNLEESPVFIASTTSDCPQTQPPSGDAKAPTNGGTAGANGKGKMKKSPKVGLVEAETPSPSMTTGESSRKMPNCNGGWMEYPKEIPKDYPSFTHDENNSKSIAREHKESSVVGTGLSRRHSRSKNALRLTNGGDTSKQKFPSESSNNSKKTYRKHQQKNNGQQIASSTVTSSFTNATTTLDVTEAASKFLQHATQHPYYSPPSFYTTSAPPTSPFFSASPHSQFGLPAPLPPCFVSGPQTHFQQPQRSSAQPLHPYLFSQGNVADVMAGAPYISFQLPPPSIAHRLSGSIHPTTGDAFTGAPFLSVPHTLPFAPPTTSARTIAMSEDERSSIIRLLSKIAAPKISSVDSQSVTINISIPEDLHISEKPSSSIEESPKPPVAINPKRHESLEVNAVSDTKTNDENQVESIETIESTSQRSSVTAVNSKSWYIPPSELQFALYLAERNENPVCVYVGDVTCILLQDLRPGVQYSIKVCCMYGSLCGALSKPKEFITLATVPTCLRSPNVFLRTRSTLSVRWGVPVDNGAKITAYTLQYAPITKGGGTPLFQTCYTGIQRFFKLTHLLPATTYMLRVAAINSHGQSPWSDAVTVMTYGLPPSPPSPPRLLKATSNSLHLTWEPHNSSHGISSSNTSKPILRYHLEIQKGEARQHFKKIYDDDATQFLVEGLRRCSLYRFRLAASNVDGVSHWSDVVAFRTAPDLPSAPRDLRLRGRVRAFQVNLYWLAPDDDGGMPVNAYSLEIFMPRLPAEILHKYNKQHKGETLHRSTFITDSHEIETDQILGRACWPWVIAPSDNNAFVCVPPSVYVLQPPTSTLYPLGKVKDIPQLPLQVLVSDSIPSPTTSLCPSESTANEATNSVYSWYTIYEGQSKEVMVCNLTPGQHFQFRVRASSHRTSVVSRPHTPSIPTIWGEASNPPLNIVTLAVPPIDPPSNLRLLGRPKPTELYLTWDPPSSNGGAPILSYELCQSFCDPITDSTTKTCSLAVGIPSSESMRDINAGAASFPLSSSCVSADATLRSAPSSVTSSPKHQSIIITHSRLTFEGVENSFKLQGLQSGHLVAVRVRARNSTGWSEWSEWSTFATAPSPPPAPATPPHVKPTSPTSVMVDWEEMKQTNGASITEYHVEWQSCVAEFPQINIYPKHAYDEGSPLLNTELNKYSRSRKSSSCSLSKYPNHDFQLVYSGPELHFELHDLRPASRVAFRVRAVNSAGAGGWSPLGDCVMPAARPSQPSGLALDPFLTPPTSETRAEVVDASETETSVGGVSMTTARLIWIAPRDNGCPITRYNIELTHCNSGQTSILALSVERDHSGAQYLTVCVGGDDITKTDAKGAPPPSLPPSPSLSVKETVMMDRGRELSTEKEDKFKDGNSERSQRICLSGSTNHHIRSSSVSFSPPLTSAGIDLGSALSSNMPLESCQLHRHRQQYCHRSSHANTSKARHPSDALDDTEYVRHTLTGLKVGTKYRIRVQALNAVGESQFSGVLQFSTLPPLPPPATLYSVGFTASSIKLRWSASVVASCEKDEAPFRSKVSAQTNVKYILEMTKKPQSKEWTTIFEGTQTSFKARKLSEATFYYFRIATINISGKGAYSSVLQEKTAYTQPLPVEAPQVINVTNSKCKLQWPPLKNMGQDPLLYLVQLTRVPGIARTTAAKTSSLSSLRNEYEAGTIVEVREGEEEEAVTVYRGAEISCTISNLVAGNNYVARVCGIRCCQIDPSEHPILSSSKAHIDKDANALHTHLPASALNSTSAKITLLHGPFSVGTAFTTLPEKRAPVTNFINSILLKSAFANRQMNRLTPSTHPVLSTPPRCSYLMPTQMKNVASVLQRLRASAFYRRVSSKELAQRRMACLFVIGFVLLTLLCAWFANQFLLKFSDDVSPAVKWIGNGGPLEDSRSSARAALYAKRGRQYH